MSSSNRICDLRATLARMGDNVTLLKQLVEFCREDLPVYMARLKAGIEAGSAPEVQMAAHSVKGLVVNFNAEPATNAAVHLERLGQTGQLTEAAAAFATLEQETSRLLSAIDEELTQF
jgi:two-component system, sensor histidine kinase and response regulator